VKNKPMDIISHTLSGIAVGTLVASFSKLGAKHKASIILIGGLGGALPDFDAISLWSKFDAVIGVLFNLNHSGSQIYFGKFWYSHHGAFHSLFTPLFLLTLFTVIIALKKRWFAYVKFKNGVIKYKLQYLAFFFGFTVHLLEDMPTPASVWGGVNLFFPSSNYVGGFGNIWWWNNYDLVLIIVAVILLNILIGLISTKHFSLKIKSTLGIFTLGVSLFIFQINTRPIDFAYDGFENDYNKMEEQSKNIQKDILGENLYGIMEAIDNKIPLYF
jgi:membrane-bound metal-dependent hydrolase YbcI (DUF457 family)